MKFKMGFAVGCEGGKKTNLDDPFTICLTPSLPQLVKFPG